MPPDPSLRRWAGVGCGRPRSALVRRDPSGGESERGRAALFIDDWTWDDARVNAELWEGQATYRRSLEQVANDVLDAAGAGLDVRAFVVGLPQDRDADVVVEPARGHFDRTIVAQSMILGTRRFNRLLREDEAADGSPVYLAALEARTRRRAVADKLDAAARATGRIHFVGVGVTVGDHTVFPVLALQEDLEELPQLPDDAGDDFLTARSFQEAVVTTVLDVASGELDRQSRARWCGSTPSSCSAPRRTCSSPPWWPAPAGAGLRRTPGVRRRLGPAV